MPLGRSYNNLIIKWACLIPALIALAIIVGLFYTAEVKEKQINSNKEEKKVTCKQN